MCLEQSIRTTTFKISLLVILQEFFDNHLIIYNRAILSGGTFLHVHISKILSLQ
jgi:hypothetical protein